MTEGEISGPQENHENQQESGSTYKKYARAGKSGVAVGALAGVLASGLSIGKSDYEYRRDQSRDKERMQLELQEEGITDENELQALRYLDSVSKEGIYTPEVLAADLRIVERSKAKNAAERLIQLTQYPDKDVAISAMESLLRREKLQQAEHVKRTIAEQGQPSVILDREVTAALSDVVRNSEIDYEEGDNNIIEKTTLDEAAEFALKALAARGRDGQAALQWLEREQQARSLRIQQTLQETE